MPEKYNLELLAPAQGELEEIARVHLQLVGPKSAQKITDKILTSLTKLQLQPNLGIASRDKSLAAEGYRVLISKPYLCFYRVIANTVFIYHVVDGRADYPILLSDLFE